jgi:N-acetyl-anhydromuramyl-L-alanine amidase AmpD
MASQRLLLRYCTLNRTLVAGSELCRIVFGISLILHLTGCRKAVDYPEAKPFPRRSAGGAESRGGKPIDLIILYSTEHPADEALKLWCESHSLSGHYIVTAKGEVWQVLRDADAGWHAGNHEFNLRSIALAVEGYADPENPNNAAKQLSWQTPEQLQALARLIKWLCERHQIPTDRTHIIGKNQVPGVSTQAFPSGGPQFWGGASNKSSPGAFWDWGRLMEKLGRTPVWRSLIVLTNCSVTTLPQTNAPVIMTASAGNELLAYDANESHWLVRVTNQSVAQPYLPPGRYHWDGWVSKASVREKANIGSRQ